MSGVSKYVFSLMLGAAMAVCAFGQAVISTRSGVVNYFEGTVSVAGQPLAAHFGKFTSVPEGAELRTEQGRAEILLTPGVFLRVAANSAVRMTSTALTDTRVELLAGSAIVESAEAAAGTSVTLRYKDWSIRQAHEGNYRIDCDPPRVTVRGGSVEVSAAGNSPVTVQAGEDLTLQGLLVPEPSQADIPDAFNDWSEGRAQSITADNAIAADIQDPASVSGNYAPADSFTYFPLLGYPSLVSSVDSNGGVYPYQSPLYGATPIQSGFYSLYLPGYTYRPLMLGVHGTGIGLTRGLTHGLGYGFSPPRYPPIRTGVPGTIRPVPRPPVVRPISPPMARPAPIHPIGRK